VFIMTNTMNFSTIGLLDTPNARALLRHFECVEPLPKKNTAVWIVCADGRHMRITKSGRQFRVEAA
jgi:hypothetical protein